MTKKDSGGSEGHGPQGIVTFPPSKDRISRSGGGSDSSASYQTSSPSSASEDLWSSSRSNIHSQWIGCVKFSMGRKRRCIVGIGRGWAGWGNSELLFHSHPRRSCRRRELRISSTSCSSTPWIKSGGGGGSHTWDGK